MSVAAPPRTGKGLLAEYYLGDNFNELFLRHRDEKIEFHTANDMTDYQTHLLKIGSPAAPPGKLPQREKVSFLPLETPLTDSAVQPPGQWKFRAWQIETSPRNLTERWFASDYDDAAWEIRTPGDLAQTISSAQAGCIGSTWYRAVVQLPAGMPPARLGHRVAQAAFLHGPGSRLVDGREVGVERFADTTGAMAVSFAWPRWARADTCWPCGSIRPVIPATSRWAITVWPR